MSGDEGTDSGGEAPDEGPVADDADVEAAIEQGSPGPDTDADREDDDADLADDDGEDDGDEHDAPGPPADDDEAGGGAGSAEDESSDAEGQVTDPDDSADTDDSGGTGVGGRTIEVEVPANLLRAWEHRASKAKLSVSEYVVRMTEAGRMSVQMQPAGGGDAAAMSVEQLSDEVVEQLRHEEAVAWEQLVDGISKNLEEQLEEALERLQEDDVVRYSGLKGGYRLVEDDT